MEIKAVKLNRAGSHLVVSVETRNGWIEVIREGDNGTSPISHICEESGLRQANSDACEQSSIDDLVSSGGIRGEAMSQVRDDDGPLSELKAALKADED